MTKYIYGTAILLIFIGWLINLFDKKGSNNILFVYDEMPTMKPLPLSTKGHGFWLGLWLWLVATRKWEIVKDWKYKIDGELFVIPKGFVFDGASVPKFLRSWLSPMGILLVGGLVHDYGYKYQTLLHTKKKTTLGVKDQKWMDETFRDINISVNGFKLLNYLAYYALRLGGFMAWNKHRTNNHQWQNSIKS